MQTHADYKVTLRVGATETLLYKIVRITDTSSRVHYVTGLEHMLMLMNILVICFIQA